MISEGINWTKRVRKLWVRSREEVAEGRTCTFAEEAVVDCPATWLPCSGRVLVVRLEGDPSGKLSLCESHIERFVADEVELRIIYEPRPSA